MDLELVAIELARLRRGLHRKASQFKHYSCQAPSVRSLKSNALKQSPKAHAVTASSLLTYAGNSEEADHLKPTQNVKLEGELPLFDEMIRLKNEVTSKRYTCTTCLKSFASFAERITHEGSHITLPNPHIYYHPPRSAQGHETIFVDLTKSNEADEVPVVEALEMLAAEVVNATPAEVSENTHSVEASDLSSSNCSISSSSESFTTSDLGRRCIVCDKKCKTSPALKRHLRSEHNLRCHICKITLDTTDKFATHYNKHVRQRANLAKYICPLCHYRALTRNGLQRHAQRHGESEK